MIDRVIVNAVYTLRRSCTKLRWSEGFYK